jgi:hypothetical protein
MLTVVMLTVVMLNVVAPMTLILATISITSLIVFSYLMLLVSLIYYAECLYTITFFTVLLNVVKLSVVMPNVVAPRGLQSIVSKAAFPFCVAANDRSPWTNKRCKTRHLPDWVWVTYIIICASNCLQFCSSYMGAGKITYLLSAHFCFIANLT